MKKVCHILGLVLPAVFAMVILACTGDGATETPAPQAQVVTPTVAGPPPTAERPPSIPTSDPTALAPESPAAASPLPTPTARPEQPVPLLNPATATALPAAAPDPFYTGDWFPGYFQDYGESTWYTWLLSYEPSIDEEVPAAIFIGCVQPANGEPSIVIRLGTFGAVGEVFDADEAEAQLSWDDEPAAVETWDSTMVSYATPQESADFGHHLVFVDRLLQHDHLTVEFSDISGWRKASFLVTGFEGAYLPVQRACFPDSVSPDLPLAAPGWTRFSYNAVENKSWRIPETYDPAPQGRYVETFDESTGARYRFYVNCTNPEDKLFWSRIVWTIPGDDEEVVSWHYEHFVDYKVDLGVEIDGEAITRTDGDWNGIWNTRGWSSPKGNPPGPLAIIRFEGIDTLPLLDYLYSLDGKELAFTFSGREHKARLSFDVTGYKEALDPLMDHCGL